MRTGGLLPPDQPQRSAFVQIEGTRSSLILETSGETPEKRAGPASGPCAGPARGQPDRAEYVRTRFSIGASEIQALHVVRPDPLDLVAVAGASEDGQDLPPLPWFGPEVSAEPTYQRRRLALDDRPDAPEVELTNSALNSLLDLLENRFTIWPLPQQAEVSDQSTAEEPQSADAPELVPEAEADQESDDFGVEDAVTRELARSLQPRRG